MVDNICVFGVKPIAVIGIYEHNLRSAIKGKIDHEHD